MQDLEMVAFTQEFLYILAAIAFIFGIKLLGRQETARWGNLLSSGGMLVAVVATFFSVGLALHWVFLGLVIGGSIGAVLALKVKMTGMPEMVALFNGTGGLASLLVATAEFFSDHELSLLSSSSAYLSVLIGGLTFTGSLIAWGKLSGKLSGSPTLFPGQRLLNGFLFLFAMSLGLGTLIFAQQTLAIPFFLGGIALALLLGVFLVIPIGGGDMPVVISLLNSFSGLAACAVGFVLLNKVLIVSGCLVGASGLILTEIMCKSMNRTLTNVLFGGFGSRSSVGKAGTEQGEAHPINLEDCFYILEAADSVVFVPGYGMAVAQAQHVVQELAQVLEDRGIVVQYAVHPVAGRMPGHMNVLLAEANVPYEQLVEMDEINGGMERVDVCMVIGANDIVNPSARTDEHSPIFGMPIINVDFAKTVIILKRSLGQGFAGIENPLFFLDNARMLFGDAKNSLQGLIREFKEGS